MTGEIAWFKISWLTIHRKIELKVLAVVDRAEPIASIEIEFGRSLNIRHLRIWIGNQQIYNEVN